MAKKSNIEFLDIDVLCEDLKMEVESMNYLYNDKSQEIWANIEDITRKKQSYKYWITLMDRNIKNLRNLCELADQKSALESHTVKEVIESWMDMFNKHEKICDNYSEKYSHEELMKLSSNRMQDEMVFRSTVKQDAISLKSIMRGVEEIIKGRNFKPKSHGEVPIPLVMRRVVEEKYPAFKKEMEEKLKK